MKLLFLDQKMDRWEIVLYIRDPQPFLAPGTGFEKMFPWPGGEGGRDGFRMTQAHYIYCALYLYYYYISPTSDHQAVDPGGWKSLH